MCGIAGILNHTDRDALDRMVRSQAHRGPDDHGTVWLDDRPVGLGHNRLSIIDLSTAGHQPMSSQDGRFWITYNGEIYNYRELRKTLEDDGFGFVSQSDTEVILHAWRRWGPTCLHKLNGMFAFAIYDCEKRALFLARDRLGIKPVYYASSGESLVFASEIKAILASGLVDREPDLFALQTPTRFQISPLTGFKNILKLPPGRVLVHEDGVVDVRKWWEAEYHNGVSYDDETAIARLDELVDDAVRLQMVADVPVGVLLSGGLDSSIITALMRKQTSQPVHAFTIRFKEQDQKYEKMVDDSFYARKVAEQFDLDYHEIEIEPDVRELLPKLVYHLDEPLADPAAINTYLISQAARDLGIVVLLNGTGGDEIFGGYRKQLACLKAEAYQRVMPQFMRMLLEKTANRLPVATSSQGLRLLRWSKRFLSFASLPQVDRFLVSDLSLSPTQYENLFSEPVGYTHTHYYKSQEPTLATKELPYLTRMCLNDTRVMLPEHNLTYGDKAAMAAGVEGRPPLTDHRIVEFMFSLPPEFRIRGNVQKYLLKKVSERYLPRDIIYRPKAPFGSPLRSWIRGPLSEMVGDLLSPSRLRARGLYNPAYVQQLVENDRNGVEDNAHIIWTLLTNEVWFQTFFDN